MGQPSILIQFQTAAKDSAALLSKGNLGVILRDGESTGPCEITEVSEIPTSLNEGNKAYLQRALIGSVNRPKKIFTYVLDQGGDEEEREGVTSALQYFLTKDIDYICPPPDGNEEDVTALISWVKKQRDDQRIYKAVVANTQADCEGVVNFTTTGIQVGDKTYTAAEYVSRIAGMIVGSGVRGSCTYLPLTEVTSFTQLGSREAEDRAADSGELILLHDGRKAKLGRAVNSLTTTSQEKGPMLKKIKIVETKDRITYDLQLAIEDKYIGRYNNDYSDKLTLLSAISAYLKEMEMAGYIKEAATTVSIDVDAQKNYLRGQGLQVDSMTDQQIKEADTDTYVFILIKIRPLDAIEDVILNIDMRKDG